MKPSSAVSAGIAALGDFTTDRRLFPMSALAVVAGSLGVAAGWILLRLISLINNICYYGVWSGKMLPPGGMLHHGHPAFWTLLIPPVGGLIVGLMARYGSEKIRGHGIPEAIEAILLGGARLDAKVAILKPVSSAIAIGSGGPFGAEGPIIMTGGATASLLAQCFSLTEVERKTLLVAGACAGMTAVFGTPIAAILLAIEVLLFELRPRSVIPVAVACVTAGVERGYLLAPTPLFPYVGGAAIDPLHALGWVGLGLVAGFAAALLTMMVYATEDGFLKLPIHWMWWPALGGIAVAVGGMIDPLALGVGYPNIANLLAGSLVGAAAIRLMLVKSVIWAAALGSGTSGGVLAPLMMTGGALGAVLAPFLPHASPGFWAVLGLAAVMAGTMRAPLTATLFAVEVTGSHAILLPVLAACMASMAVTVMLLRRSILTEKVARRGHHLTCEFGIDPLAIARAGEFMATPAETLSADSSVGEAIAFFQAPEPRHRVYPVVDAAGVLVGLVSSGDILAWLGDSAPRDVSLREALAGRPVVTAEANETAINVAARMLAADVARVPVIDRDGRLRGIVGRADLLRVRSKVFSAELARERFLLRRQPAPSARRPRIAAGAESVGEGRTG